MTTSLKIPARKQIDLANRGLPEVPLLGMANMTTAHSPMQNHIHQGLMEIHYLRRGEQIFNVEGKNYTLKSGDLFITWPTDQHSTGKTPHGRNIWYWTQFRLPQRPAKFLGMSAKMVWPVIKQLHKLPCRHFHADKCIDKLYKEIFALAQAPSSETTTARIANRYMLWLLTVIECSQRSGATMQTEDIKSIVAMIKSNPQDDYFIESLAEQAMLSVSHFKAKFKLQTGLPPHELILRVKVKHAQKLLQNTNESVTTIAYDLGFSSSQYFATVYRRFYNSSPSDVRKVMGDAEESKRK